MLAESTRRRVPGEEETNKSHSNLLFAMSYLNDLSKCLSPEIFILPHFKTLNYSIFIILSITFSQRDVTAHTTSESWASISTLPNFKTAKPLSEKFESISIQIFG